MSTTNPNGKPPILDHAATLADFTRCRMLAVLDHAELSVGELCQVLQLPQSTTSRHLKVLADGDWVRKRSEGTSHFYQLVDSLDEPTSGFWAIVREQLRDAPTCRQDRLRLDGILRLRRSRSQEFFSASAQEWDLLRDELFGDRFDLLALAGLCDPRWTIGDLACGTGRLSAALAPFVERVIALDGSAAMLEAARERLQPFSNVTLREGDLEDLPLEDSSLDAATLILALHHAAEPVRVLTEARRVLAPGGRLLIVDMLPHNREDFRTQMGHLWLGFSETQMLRDLQAAGFEKPRMHPLPASPDARGPVLFVASACSCTSPKQVSLPSASQTNNVPALQAD